MLKRGVLSMVLGVMVITGPVEAGNAVLADRSVVHFMADNDVAELKPIRKLTPGEQVDDFTTLPLILTEPKDVHMQGQVYRIEMEGLYRFFDLFDKQQPYDRADKRQVILHRSDVWRLAAAIAKLRVHGTRHGKLSVARWLEMARLGERISVSCGGTAQLVMTILGDLGFKTRMAGANSMAPRSWDAGHNMCEIFDPQQERWILFDADGGCRFRYEDRLLDHEETCNLYRVGKCPELEFISWSQLDTFDHDAQAESQTRAYGFMQENFFRNEASRHGWYERILNIPRLNGEWAVASDEEAKQYTAYHGAGRPCIPWDEWREQHYGVPSSLPAPEPMHLRELDAGMQGDLVEYLADNVSVSLLPRKAPEGATVQKLEALPLVVNEAVWAKWNGRTYCLDQEGMYRLIQGRSSCRSAQRILYRGDPWRLAGHLSRLHVYGWHHDRASHRELDDLARNGTRLSLSSFAISQFVSAHLETQSVQIRVCGTVTMDEWHDYYRWDNLRYLCEIFDPTEKRWMLFDAEVGCRFYDQGKLLDLGEVCDLYRTGKTPQLDFISWPVVVDMRERYGNRYTFYTHIMESVFRGEKALHNWYARMFQVPFQQNGSERVFGVRSDEEFEKMVLLLRNHCNRLDAQEWRETYYTGIRE